ncbi:hypothetical protein GT347_15015 [Xylophilus rhododendri]|uniref:SAF domain-containing protein n=1 Tax=Xylophilus rhododendri TaxID=2697032 RepID=A0A857J7W8_9BURK|nr:flagella basal body P-ring formation protein FlgA [Xylophilus rhododendri]QHI99171.1 hypothetical protein GT347_15015 [Xylophilus rhododendri]
MLRHHRALHALPAALAGLLLLAAWPAPGRAAQAVASLELRPEASVTRAEVRLTDVALIRTSSLPLLQRLMALPIGQVAVNGEASVLERARVSRWIRSQQGLAQTALAWSGPEAVQVRLALHTVSGARIAAAARGQLQQQLQEQPLRAEIELAQPPRDVQAPGQDIQLRPRPTELPLSLPLAAQGGNRAAGMPTRRTVWVELWADERFLRLVPVVFDVHLYGTGLLAARDLGAGEELAPDPAAAGQAAVHEVEWSGRMSAPLPAALRPDTAALRLRRPVAAGRPLTQSDVEAVPAVRQGSFVRLLTGQGPVALESRAEVLDDAAPGQAVRVRLPGAATSLKARVTGPGAVELAE